MTAIGKWVPGSADIFINRNAVCYSPQLISNPEKMISPFPRIFADFHNADRLGRLRLNCRGTIDDLEKQNLELQENQKLMLYMDELECEGIVTHSADENMW